jgi:hypothetical protein
MPLQVLSQLLETVLEMAETHPLNQIGCQSE